jgi:hypothetical protein
MPVWNTNCGAAARRKVVTKSACLLACTFVAASLSPGSMASADEFTKVQCGGDIPKAMIGQHSPNEPIVALEKKYRALGLKGLGGDEISDQLSSVNWMICGNEYIVLVDHAGLVRDAMAFPPHSKSAPAFSAICQLKGKDLPDVFVGVLDGSATADLLPVQTAWKIDQKRAKFVKASTEGLSCPRSGIITADGGR